MRAGRCEEGGLFRGLDIYGQRSTIHPFGTALETDLHTWNECMMMIVGSMYLMAHFGITEMKKRGRGPHCVR